MTDPKPDLKLVDPKPVPADADDLASLWLDTGLGDGLTDARMHNVPVGKPRDFFRVHPDPTYRRLSEIYTHKVEGQVEETSYLIDKPMHGVIEEARRATLVTVIYRDGSVRLWPLKLPKEGEKDYEAWTSARAAAREAMKQWTKLLWKRGTYHTRPAQPGYAPDPDYTKVPPWDDLVRLAFGDHGIIRDHDHPIVRDLFGHKPDGGDDGLS
jgi:hypothetical protein